MRRRGPLRIAPVESWRMNSEANHQVLARKYRPRSFEELRGQEHVVQALSNALTQGRLHHAYLFTGTRGVGKTTVSRLLAKCLNCTGSDGQGGVTSQPCGECPACRDIDAGRFVDYVELDAASNRGVDEITLLLDQAVYKPVVGRFKVYMIDEVHMLSTTAFNAMLKTLEEPPDYLKFVLATTDPQKVPPTVLSRCLQFNLRPMAPQTVQAHLVHVLQAEGFDAEPGALRLLARAARGSMRDALSLTDQAIAYGAGVLNEAGVRQMLGAVDRSHAVGIVDAIAASDAQALVAVADALRGLGLSATGTLEELAQLLQNMAVVQAVAGSLDADDPQTPITERLAALIDADELQVLYRIALQGRAELSLAPDEYSGLVMVLLRMLAFRPQGARPDRAPSTSAAVPMVTAARSAALAKTSPSAVSVTPSMPAAKPVPARKPSPAASRTDDPPSWLDVPDEIEAAADVSTRPAKTQAATLPASPPIAVQPPLSRTALGDRWDDIVQRMIRAGAITALTRELASQAQCVAVSDDSTRWQLRVERESLRASAQCEKLQAALSAALGHAATLHVDAGAAVDTPAQRAAAERDRRQHEAEQIIHDDPLVKALMAQYKTARIVPGSVKPV